MKISELQIFLEEIKAKEGDLDIACRDGYDCDDFTSVESYFIVKDTDSHFNEKYYDIKGDFIVLI